MEHIRMPKTGPNGQYFHLYAEDYLERHRNATMEEIVEALCDFLDGYNGEGIYMVEHLPELKVYNFLICFDDELPFNYTLQESLKVIEV